MRQEVKEGRKEVRANRCAKHIYEIVNIYLLLKIVFHMGSHHMEVGQCKPTDGRNPKREHQSQRPTHPHTQDCHVINVAAMMCTQRQTEVELSGPYARCSGLCDIV